MPESEVFEGMVAVADLDFKAHPTFRPPATQAKVHFANGYSLSIVTGPGALADAGAPYEMCPSFGGNLLTDHLEGDLTAADVNAALILYEALGPDDDP